MPAPVDRFGRTKFQRWYRYASANTAFLDEWDYTYDYAGNRLTRDLDSANVSGGPTDHDQKFTYDGLHRLKTYDEGQLSGSSITNKRQAQGLKKGREPRARSRPVVACTAC